MAQAQGDEEGEPMTTATTNKTNAEVMYGNFTNVAGATVTTGHAVAFTTTAASLDGNSAVHPAVGQLRTFAGISNSDVPDTQSGRYIAYGYAASVYIFGTGTSVTTAIDNMLGPGVAGSFGVNSTGLKGTFGPVNALAAIGAAINSPGGYASGFVRAM